MQYRWFRWGATPQLSQRFVWSNSPLRLHYDDKSPGPLIGRVARVPGHDPQKPAVAGADQGFCAPGPGLGSAAGAIKVSRTGATSGDVLLDMILSRKGEISQNSSACLKPRNGSSSKRSERQAKHRIHVKKWPDTTKRSQNDAVSGAAKTTCRSHCHLERLALILSSPMGLMGLDEDIPCVNIPTVLRTDRDIHMLANQHVQKTHISRVHMHINR